MRLHSYLVFVFCLIKYFALGRKIDKIYEVLPKNETQWLDLFEISRMFPDFDFLNIPGIENSTATAVISLDNLTTFENVLKEKSINFNIVNHNLFKTIKSQTKQGARGLFHSTPKVSFKKYHRYEEIMKYLKYLGKQFPERVKIENIGKSFENKDLTAIRISDGSSVQNKKIIFIDAGIHAREWIAPAAALYTIYQFVEKFDDNKHLLRGYEWIVLPLLNPDGYEYTHKRSANRLWRKTRKPTTNPKCKGVDGNRNFDYRWGLEPNATDECSHIYPGPNPFSEPETRALRDYLKDLSNKCKMYLTLHSYGRYIFLPYAWDTYPKFTPKNYGIMLQIAEAGKNAIIAHNTQRYLIGQPAMALKKISGASMDYAHAVLRIPVTFSMELGHDRGFDPAKNEILGLVEEAWAGIKAMALKLKALNV